MFEVFLESLIMYYGLDWASLCAGLLGNYLITQKSKYGLLLVALACFCGLLVAMISHQFGFIVGNIITVLIMTRGYFSWSSEEEGITQDALAESLD